MVDGHSVHTQKKAYVSKYARAKDENTCDGVHAVIYNTDSMFLRVYDNENEIDKVYDWLEENVECGTIPEWKTYLYNKLYQDGHIHSCVTIDHTGKAPKILVLSNEINTELIRSIKAEGLKNGIIKLDVEEIEPISNDLTFLDIINGKIISYIENLDCHYNVGDEISPILKKSFVKEGKQMHLFPSQVQMCQGIVNAVKDGINYPILNGGMGVGKTITSIYAAYTIIREVQKKKNARIGIFLQSHLINKWKREIESVFAGREKISFITLERFTDVNKLSKEPDGIEFLILPKDRVKRKYLEDHSTSPKYKTLSKADDKFSKCFENVETIGNVKLIEVEGSKYIKYLAVRLEKFMQSKVVIYSPYYDKEHNVIGYYISTTSKVLKEKLGTELGKSYNCKFKGSKEELISIIEQCKSEIDSEKIINKERYIENPYVCPTCGGYIYEKPLDVFDIDECGSYQKSKFKGINESNTKCSAYIKADGTSLTMQEMDYIRKGITNFLIVEGKYKNPYLNEDGSVITGDELVKVKRNPRGCTILVRRCSEKVVGYKDQKGYRTYSVADYLYRKFGKNCINMSIYDEAHLVAALSNQGYSFATFCRLSKVNLTLTGTLTSGKASDLFYFLYRLCPQQMKDNGYNYNDISLFVEHYGRRKKETVEYAEKYNKSGKKVSSGWKELPGMSPVLYAKNLANCMISRKLEDLNIPLPEVKYFKHEIEMSSELSANYNRMKDDYVSFMKRMEGVNVGGSYIHNLISYPDLPNIDDIYVNVNGEPMFITSPTKMDIEGKLLPKEMKLLDTCRREIAEGRKMLLFAVYTGVRGISKRLMEILKKEFKIAELTSKIKLKKREEWIEEQYSKGIDIICTNPENCATGLDIIQYPTIYFYEIPCNTKTLRQAKCRPIRPTQKSEVRIYYSYYKDTLQEDILKLQMQKETCSLALEGVYDDNMLSQMGNAGDSIESQLNKILQGKMKLTGNELDGINFADETSFEFSENKNGNVNVTRTVTTSETVEFNKDELEQVDLFTINQEFIKKSKGKIKKNLMEGQIGFVF